MRKQPTWRQQACIYVGIVSVVLLLAVAVLWVRSYWAMLEVWQFRRDLQSLESREGDVPGRLTQLLIDKGRFQVLTRDTEVYHGALDPVGVTRRITWYEPPFPRWTSFVFPQPWYSARFASGNGNWFVSFPLWMPCFALLVPVAMMIWKARRAGRRARRGVSTVCPECQYDCRATPDRCPECGHVLREPTQDWAAALERVADDSSDADPSTSEPKAPATPPSASRRSTS